jgi:hypothetical protein
MADGDNARWWSQAKSAVAAWWHRSGWKTISTVAVPLAITFGVIDGIQRIELQDHHLHIDPTGPNWAEIVTAFSTFALAVAAFLALRSIDEAKSARIALQMNECRGDGMTRPTWKCVGKFTITPITAFQDDCIDPLGVLAWVAGPRRALGRIDSRNAS